MAAALKPLLPEIVFVGGCTTGLLISDPAASPVRATDDVDVIVEVASYAEYARFSKRLRNLGFFEDSSEGAPICRWLIDQMKLDVMPTDEIILGFSNRWYKPAIEAAALVELDGFQLRVVTTPYFIGTNRTFEDHFCLRHYGVGKSADTDAKLLLHYGRRIVAIKGYDLSTLEVKNIDTRDIYCLALGSYSFRTKGQLTFMRPPNSKLDDDDVLRDVDA
jgi:hypothetical protein